MTQSYFLAETKPNGAVLRNLSDAVLLIKFYIHLEPQYCDNFFLVQIVKLFNKRKQ